ncbi:MAG TPA: FixH family protein [Edaphocola sp.]|nr:FixH family protein [Edaphocola sp.]
MKIIKHLSIILLFFGLFSCDKTEKPPIIDNPLDGKILFQKFQDNDHIIELYTESGKLKQGYNRIFLQLKKSDNSILENPNIQWNPLMHMSTTNHSCPYSTLKLSGQSKTVLEGYIIFQMASNNSEFWELKFDYTVDGQSYQVSDTIEVLPSTYKNTISFKGADSVKYLIALAAPQNPKIGTNDMSALLFKMENMMSFPAVNGYTIQIDPRMPSMGNHSSPNNEHLKQTNEAGFYNGKLNLTMTGYWKINLQLLDKNQNNLKGEAITPSNESSSIFLEIEL